MRSLLYLAAAFLLVESEYYTDFWAVHIEGGPDVARAVAKRHGFTYVDRVRSSFKCACNLNVLLHLLYY